LHNLWRKLVDYKVFTQKKYNELDFIFNPSIGEIVQKQEEFAELSKKVSSMPA